MILATLGGIVGWNLYQYYIEKSSRAAWRRKIPQVAVEIEPVRRKTIRDIGVFTGSLRPKSRFIIAPKISGRLEKLQVDIGDRVQPGQLIAVLDSEEHAQQRKQSKAQLAVVRANLEANKAALVVSKRELERVKALNKKKLVSPSDLDASISSYNLLLSKWRVTKAQLMEKEAAFEVANIRLSYTRVTVPKVDPKAELVIGERFVDRGTLLTPNAAIVSIIDISHLTAVIHVTERDYAKLKVNQTASIYADSIRDKAFKGRIARIAPLIKEMSREAQVEIDIPSPGGLIKPGMFIKAFIQFRKKPNARVVPLAAVVDRKTRRGVFLADLEKNNVKFIELVLGITEGDFVEVIKPVISGQVVTLGHHLLQNGSAIRVPNLQPKADKKDPKGGKFKNKPGMKKSPQ